MSTLSVAEKVDFLLPRRFTDIWLIMASLFSAVIVTFIGAPRWVGGLGWLFTAVMWWLTCLMRTLIDDSLGLLDEPSNPRRLRVIRSAALTLPCTCRRDHDGVIGLPCARCQIVTEAEGEKL